MKVFTQEEVLQMHFFGDLIVILVVQAEVTKLSILILLMQIDSQPPTQILTSIVIKQGRNTHCAIVMIQGALKKLILIPGKVEVEAQSL